MTITPKTAARQIVAARAERAHKPVFTSQTGVVRPVHVSKAVPMEIVEDDPHCFVCGRHTDHFAEHDDMVDAGTARYGQNDDGTFNGNVYPIPWGWDLG